VTVVQVMAIAIAGLAIEPIGLVATAEEVVKAITEEEVTMAAANEGKALDGAKAVMEENMVIAVVEKGQTLEVMTEVRDRQKNSHGKSSLWILVKLPRLERWDLWCCSFISFSLQNEGHV
jgi:hypothetical protein